jgi:cell division protein FtsI/penicillin-binding protein 2
MQAVVQTGTAEGVFKGNALNCHVYGKTGTADIGKKETAEHRISSWFIGWYAPKTKPTVAFACMATHYPSGKGNGAKICGEIMNNILTEMLRQGVQP